MKTQSTLTALAPTPEPFDPAWSHETLTSILADARPQAARPRRSGRRLAALVAAGVVVVSAGTAVAVGGPVDAVRGAIEDFSKQPNTTGNGLGVLHDPELVAQFETPNGLFSFWVATSSTGKICYASSDGEWNGQGVPRKDQIEYGCGGEVYTGPGQSDSAPLTVPEQLGGFFKDTDGPIVYGISPYDDAVRVRVRGQGIDRTLPLRADSHGYGAAVPEAADAPQVTFTFLDVAGHVLGTRSFVAPIG
jgi:hypothetical protein